MKCKNCGNEVSDSDVFCPVCSALLTRKHNKLSELLSKLKTSANGKDAVAIMCLCEIALSVLFIFACFCKVFTISGSNVYGSNVYIQLSWYDCFVGNSRFNFILIIFLSILTDIVLLYFVIKKSAVPRLMLLIPAATYVWNLSQFITRVAAVSKTTVYSEGSPSFDITLIGWMIPAICVVSIVILAVITLKLNKKPIAE